MALLSLAPAAWAGAGKDGFQFLKLAGGARAAAMAGADGALAEDATAALASPAALSFFRGRELSVGYAALPADLSLASLAYAQAWGKGAFHAQALTLRSGEIPRYEAGSGARSGVYDVEDRLLAAGYGRAVSQTLGWGVNLKQVTQSVADRSAAVNAVDLGGVARLPGGGLQLSAALENVGGQATFVRDGTSLPRAWRVGARWKGLSDALVLAVENQRPADGEGRLRLGGEAWLYNALALRAGFEAGREAGSNLTLGLGFKLKDVRLDYAFAARGGAFEAAHRVGLTFRFSGSGGRSYEEGLRLAQRDLHAEAILKFKEALDAEPGHREAVRALRESVQALERRRAGGEK